MIITIPDDDTEVNGSKTASKAEAPASFSLDSPMCQSKGNYTGKNASNPDPATPIAARGRSIYSRSMSVVGVPSDQAALNTEPRSHSETFQIASLQNSTSAHFDGMSLQSILVAQQYLMIDLKAWSCSLKTIP